MYNAMHTTHILYPVPTDTLHSTVYTDTLKITDTEIYSDNIV